MRGRRAPLAFVGIDELDGRPHIVVDGSKREASALVLSHWPSSPTPKSLWRDLSTEIAFAYLDRHRFRRPRARAVTSDHLDEDGLAAIFVLAYPNEAARRRDALIALARVGDFGVVANDRIAQTALALAMLFDPERSPLASQLRAEERIATAWTGRCYAQLLHMLGELLDRPEQYRSSWEDEYERYQRSAAAVSSGAVTVVEDTDLGLAVVDVPSALGDLASPIGHGAFVALHPWALHSATWCPRMLVVFEQHYCYYDRYETWVRYVSRSLPRRRALGPLAQRLSGQEPAGTRWAADGPGALVPVLAPVDGTGSGLSRDVVVRMVREHLAMSPVAWDPFRGGGALVSEAL